VLAVLGVTWQRDLVIETMTMTWMTMMMMTMTTMMTMMQQVERRELC
jgi:hypothetical protein